MTGFLKFAQVVGKYPVHTLLVVVILATGYQAWHYRNLSDDLQQVIDDQVIEHDLALRKIALLESEKSLCESGRDQLSQSIPEIKRTCKRKIDSAVSMAIAKLNQADIKPARSAEEFNRWIDENIKD